MRTLLPLLLACACGSPGPTPREPLARTEPRPEPRSAPEPPPEPEPAAIEAPPEPTPTPPARFVAGLSDATAIHGPCASSAEDGIVCWSPRWSWVPEIPGGTEFALDEGYNVCAIIGGRISCWHHDEYRERVVRSARPGVRGAHALTKGYEQMCALDARGRVFCGGRRMRRVEGITRALDVRCANAECCVVTPDGSVSCWSDAFFAEGCSDCGHTASALHPIEGLTEITSLVADNERFCARRAEGRTWCWTSAHGSHSGLMDSGPIEEIEGASDLSMIRPWGGVTAEGAVRYFDRDAPPGAPTEGVVEISDAECGRLRDGRVRCWGPPGRYEAERMVVEETPSGAAGTVSEH